MGPCRKELADRHQGTTKPGKLDSAVRRAKKLVELFVYKSLAHFCHSAWTLEEYRTGMRPGEIMCPFFGRDYYPAVVFHRSEDKSDKLGFVSATYKSRIGFYAEQASRLFQMAVDADIFTYDLYMKRAQLSELEIPGTVVLVDESQDVDGCQIDWAARAQVELYGKLVYVVGDPAQAIYGFRGAKSQHLMDLPSDRRLFLTGSFRFGQSITNVANLVLFAKRHSDHTSKLWNPATRSWRWKNWDP